MALYRPVRPNSMKQSPVGSMIPSGSVRTPPRIPQQYDVISGPAPMHTTPAFKGNCITTPQLGLHLGFNK